MKRILKNSKYSLKGNLTSQEVLDEIIKWDNPRTQGHRVFEYENLYLERHSISSIINNYIKYFNQNVDEYSDGYATDWDPDDTMTILYRDGKTREVSPQWDDGTKKIKTEGIDSIILSGSWGEAFAGPNIVFGDHTYYDDIVDIRVEFKC